MWDILIVGMRPIGTGAKLKWSWAQIGFVFTSPDYKFPLLPLFLRPICARAGLDAERDGLRSRCLPSLSPMQQLVFASASVRGGAPNWLRFWPVPIAPAKGGSQGAAPGCSPDGACAKPATSKNCEISNNRLILLLIADIRPARRLRGGSVFGLHRLVDSAERA